MSMVGGGREACTAPSRNWSTGRRPQYRAMIRNHDSALPPQQGGARHIFDAEPYGAVQASDKHRRSSASAINGKDGELGCFFGSPDGLVIRVFAPRIV